MATILGECRRVPDDGKAEVAKEAADDGRHAAIGEKFAETLADLVRESNEREARLRGTITVDSAGVARKPGD